MAKKVQQKCGTCKWLRPRSDGKPFHHSHTYACQWRLPEGIKFPDSLRGYNWRSTIENLGKGALGSYMALGEGKECPCWELREAS